MNLQAQMAGQYPRQVTNQAGISLSSIPQQHNSMQNSEGPHALLNLEPERQFIQDWIYKFIMQKRNREIPPKNIMDIVRRLEEGLFKSASTKEEYLNVDTLESRLLVIIKASKNQQYHQRSDASASMGQMIPTPGVPQSGNSSLMAQSSANRVNNNMMMSSGVNQGSFSINTLGSSRSTHNDGVSSMGGQRMMPTPGFNNNTSNQSYVNSSVDSTMVTHPLQMKQQVGDHNSQIFHMGGGIRSTLAQKSYGSLNENLTMMGKSSQVVNSLGNSDGFMTDSHYGNSHYQHQGQISQGDGLGNFFIPTTSGTSQMSINSVNLSTLQRTSSPMMVNQSNLHNSSQPANIQPSLNQSETRLRSQQPLKFQKHQTQPQRQRNQKFPYGRSPLISSVVSQIKPEPQVYEQFLSSRGSQSHGIDTQNNVTGQPTSVPQGQWQSRLPQPSHQLGNSSNESENFFQNNNNNNNSNNTSQSLEASILAKRPVDLSPDSFRNQQRWILFLRHAHRCIYPPGKCPEQHCIIVQKLWKHMMSCCDGIQCQFSRCHRSKKLVNHHKYCKDQSCPVCVPVNDFVQRPGVLVKDLPQLGNRSRDHTSEDSHRSIKRTKIDQPPAAQSEIEKENENPIIPVSITSEDLQDHDTCQPLKYEATLDLQNHDTCQPLKYKSTLDLQDHDTCQALKYKATLDLQGHDTCQPLKYEATGVKIEVSSSSMNIGEANNDGGSNEDTVYPKQVFSNTEKEMGLAKQDDVALVAETSKTGKPKIKGVSMIELFTPEQVREHIMGLRQWVGQSKVKVEKHQAMELSMNENSCQLCAVEKLNFEPPPIYCSPCGARIKRNAMFYTWGSSDTRHFICIPCYNDSRGDAIHFDGTDTSKSKLEKKKNDEETEEPWVQCDKCEAWQHQVCALFNGRRNDGGQAEYTCPTCYVEEVENGERVPLPQSALLGAKDLPRTILSDHIENRLFKRLRQERLDRARFYGKSYDEVPGPESLVVRVVSSVDKKLEVKQRFLEIFQEENYPSEFGYKSKVVLLFQKIEGVEVCLFGMYVQEFGAECVQPNHRRVYLSYLDSVKYFRPEIRTVTGEALRTFVYHEILIGYLEYCKLRGFTSCYIWACPPLKGEDYILYCHPEIQKTPKSDKLREWYLQMLKKASKENIVVELTNLYDHFFVQSGECKAKVTAARLPYFDGDYWPGAAEDIIYKLQQEEGRKNRKGSNKRAVMKRALKASGQTDLSSNASKDVLLMHRLGETISPMKEDFIMVHLQHACTHCCLLMVSGKRWVCNNCKNFQLCNSCFEVEQNLEDRERHPITQRMKHPLHPIEIKDVPTGTIDKDETLESEFFDTRQAFLSLCQGNHYQYDTLRRAKHSSMMALYHLHNPTAPAFVINCNICRLDIEAGQGWRCDICPDFDICNACYLKDGGASHPHKLTHHPSVAEREAQNKEARQQRVSQLRKMLDLLVHASQCKSVPCPYPNCTKVRGLFRHGRLCKVRASGGCPLCKKMWHLIQLHARACKDSACSLPRCSDLREHLRRLNQQADSRRRAAVMEMMRQRAAEVAAGSG